MLLAAGLWPLCLSGKHGDGLWTLLQTPKVLVYFQQQELALQELSGLQHLCPMGTAIGEVLGSLLPWRQVGSATWTHCRLTIHVFDSALIDVMNRLPIICI